MVYDMLHDIWDPSLMQWASELRTSMMEVRTLMSNYKCDDSDLQNPIHNMGECNNCRHEGYDIWQTKPLPKHQNTVST